MSGLGIPQAISLVLGSIIGVGVFNLPASLAPYGPISLVALEATAPSAQDGLFPARFDRLSSPGVPVFGILVSGVLASVLVSCPTSARPA